MQCLSAEEKKIEQSELGLLGLYTVEKYATQKAT